MPPKEVITAPLETEALAQKAPEQFSAPEVTIVDMPKDQGIQGEAQLNNAAEEKQELPPDPGLADSLSLEGDGAKAEGMLKEPLMVYDIAEKQIEHGDPYSAVITRNRAQEKLFPGTQAEDAPK